MNEKLISLMADMEEQETLALVKEPLSKGIDPMYVNSHDVLNIGIDVPVDTFVEKIKEFKPRVVGLSGFLTLAFDSMKKTVEAIEAAGLRDSLTIMIGGSQIDEEVRKYTRADAYGKDAVAAVQLSKQWIEA